MYFTPEKDPKIDFASVDKDALLMLERARGLAGIPFTITSSHRTPEHSIAVGGLNNDAHTESPCTAFDISTPDSATRFKVVAACVQAGFPRIGINFQNKHVHVDSSKRLPGFVMWIEDPVTGGKS